MPEDPLPGPAVLRAFQEATDFNLQYWLGNYYNGADFDAFVTWRQEEALDFDWSQAPPPPGVHRDDFSVFWQGIFNFAKGWKEFTITADGGIRLYVDGRLVFDRWGNSGLNTWTATIYTETGPHYTNPGQPAPDPGRRLEVRYRQGAGAATGVGAGAGGRVRVSWRDESPPAAVPVNAWRADYYTTAQPVGYYSSRLETAIDNEYRDGSYDSSVYGGQWSARWAGDWDFAGGDHAFTAVTSDGMRVWVDGQLVLDEWRPQPPTTYTFHRSLPAGRHRIEVHCFKHGSGTACAKLKWE